MGSFAVRIASSVFTPPLDQDCVPGYFVAWIVYHEMLHASTRYARERPPSLSHAGFPRRGAHLPRVRARCAWEKQNLDRLLKV